MVFLAGLGACLLGIAIQSVPKRACARCRGRGRKEQLSHGSFGRKTSKSSAYWHIYKW